MSNLIITIISIALVAVATAMGIYYGGSAYEDATAQAAANQMISDAQQIAAAYQMYSNANGGTLNAPDDHFSFLVTQGYLDAIPSSPSVIITGSDKLDSYECRSGNYDLFNGASADCINTNITLPVLAIFRIKGNVANSFSGPTAVQLKVCQDIANQARGQGAPIDTTYFIDYSTSLFDCAAEDPNIGHAGEYDFVYRIL